MTRDISAFFIVGAPRCGTTAMARYLGKHPEICFSKPKETHYFTFPCKTSDPDAMRAEFLDAYYPAFSKDTLVIGEGAVSTLYARDAIERILRSFQSPKFIVMLRDPVELLQSYHARLLYLRQEDEPDLAKAWALQDARAQGRHIPRNCQDPRVLAYAEIARLGHYSDQLITLVGRENCMPVFFDDFLTDTLASYQAVLSFLGVPYDGRVSFMRTNPSSSYKIGWLQSLYTGPLMRPVANQLMRNPVQAARWQRALRKMRKKLKRFNAIEANASPLDPGFIEDLRQIFREDILLLGNTFGKDLSQWIAPTDTSVTQHGTSNSGD